ncbi:MAG TPA: serine/threonine-protein kinase [Candidatus Krumholzibacteria bacterium]|nr:serine/threonine-protein kinase [Candidatus Krumholzibacteria bacterium]
MAGEAVRRPEGLPGRYEVLGVLGSGGMGRVLHARDGVLGREVAIKVLADHCAADDEYVRRFLTEARAAASINHPNVVQIYEFGREAGCTYLVMEYVDGVSLKRAMAASGRYSERRAAELVGEACKALGAAHERGVVHRDVKPDNMMLTVSGVFKLVDLGLAKRLADHQDQTATGRTLGTPHYISPEQILGSGVVDHRADIYSLGASLYCLATGAVPFDGTSGAHIMARHLNDALPDPRRLAPELSPDFCRVVFRAMEKDPARRHASTGELGAELEAVRAAAPAGPDHVRVEPADPTMTILQTPSGAAFCPAFAAPCPPADLDRMESALAIAIGPLARVLVGRESRHARTRPALVEALAAHIGDAAERRRFLRSCGLEESGASSASASGTASSSRSGAAPAASAALDPEIMGAVTRHLADRIGPLARVIVRREAAAGGPLSALVERLAAHVPAGGEREGFLKDAARLT